MEEKIQPLRVKVKDASTDDSLRGAGARMWLREEEEPPGITGHCISCDYKFTYPEGLQWKYVLKIVDNHYWMCPNNIQIVLDRLRRQFHKRGTSIQQDAIVPEIRPPPAPKIYSPSESSCTVHSASESIKTPPLSYACSNVNVSQEAGQETVNTQMSTTSPVRGQQGFVIHKVRQPTIRKKNMMDESARRRLLELDEWALKVRPTSVVCKACRRVISLDKRSRYYPGLWIKHREKCPKVLKLSRRRTQSTHMTAERGENTMFEDRLGGNIRPSPIDKGGKARSDGQMVEETDSEVGSSYNEATYATSYSSCSIPSSPVPLSDEKGRKKRMRTYSASPRSTRARYDAGSDSGLRVEMESCGKAERGSHTQRLITHHGAYVQVKRVESHYRTNNTGQNLTEAKFDRQLQDTTANQRSQPLRTFSTDNVSLDDESSDSEYGHHSNRTYLTPSWNGHIRAATSDHYHDLSPTMNECQCAANGEAEDAAMGHIIATSAGNSRAAEYRDHSSG